jgi:ferric-dicitrate binding protein FerR (iron transport regulator)
MPPEQEEGRGDIDQRADIFALGSMLAQTTGQGAPAALRAIAARAMQPRPEDRYQSVEALAADLTRFRAGERVEAHQETSAEKAVRVYRRYELPILLLLAYIVMRFALLIWRGI